jgi:hypothetical protein
MIRMAFRMGASGFRSSCAKVAGSSSFRRWVSTIYVDNLTNQIAASGGAVGKSQYSGVSRNRDRLDTFRARICDPGHNLDQILRLQSDDSAL